MLPVAIWSIYLLDKLLASDTNTDSIDLKNLIYLINYAKSSFYLITAILTLFERKKLVEEIDSSPLSCIDECLTEDLYKNIISQSKNPDDHQLIEEYKRLTINNRNTNKTYNNVNESHESGVISGKAGSINFNPDKSMSSKDKNSNDLKLNIN
jgi:hypothetical protein